MTRGDPDSFSKGYTRYILGLILLVMLMNTVDRHVVAILAEDIKADLGLSDRQLGWILGPSFAIVYGLAVLPVARLSDRGVRRTIIAIGLFFWSLFTAATAWTQSFVQLFAMRMGVGVGEAAASPASQSLISDLFPPEQRGRALSAISIGAVLGLAVGMAGGGWLNELYGWRIAIFVVGVPGIALAFVFRLTVREPVRGQSEVRGSQDERRGTVWEDTRYLFSLSSFRWLVVAHALALFFSIGKGSWEPTFIRRVFDMGSGAAGTWYFLTTPFPSALGIFAGGWLSDRWGRRDPRARMWVPVIAFLASFPFLLAFLLWPEDQRVAMPWGLPALPLAILPSIAGSMLGAMYTAPMLSTVQELSRLRMRASAAAIFSISGSALGSGLGPLLVGDLTERLAPTYGDEAIRYALVWLLGSLFLCAITAALAARHFREDLLQAREEASGS